MRLTKLDFSSCIGIEVILASAIAVATAMGQHSVVSLLFALSFVIAFLYVGMDTVNRRKLNISKVIVAIFLVVLVLFLLIYS